MNVPGLIAALAIAALLGPVELLIRLDAQRRARRTTTTDTTNERKDRS